MGLFNRRKKQPEQPEEPVRRLSYQVANLQGLGARERQEDAFAFANALDVTEIRRKGLLAAVADGMGGLSDGKLVSEAAIAGLLQAFENLDREGNLPAQLRHAVSAINERLYETFGGSGGTTLVAALCYEERLYWVSVGDSFLYLQRGGALFRLNGEHNYRNELYLEAIRQDRLEHAAADADPDGARLTSFLGDSAVRQVDQNLRPLRLQAGDVLLLCSDGVGAVLGEGELLAALCSGTPQQTCRRMEEKIENLHRAGQDNYTALVVSCGF